MISMQDNSLDYTPAIPNPKKQCFSAEMIIMNMSGFDRHKKTYSSIINTIKLFLEVKSVEDMKEKFKSYKRPKKNRSPYY